MQTAITILTEIGALATPIGAVIAAIAALLSAYHSYVNGRSIADNHAETQAMLKLPQSQR